MKPNIELHKPNRKSYTIIIWGVFLKAIIEQNKKTIEVNNQAVDGLQNYILDQIRKEHDSKFI